MRLKWGKIMNLLATILAFLLSGSAWAGFTKIDDATNTRQIASGMGKVAVLKDNGEIWVHAGGNWKKIDNANSEAKQIAVGADGAVYLLKNNGNIWSIAPFSQDWQKIDNGTGTAMIAVGHALYALKDNGNIWRYRSGQWSKADGGTGTRAISAMGDLVWILKESGNIWRFAEYNGQFTLADTAAGHVQISGGNSGVVSLKNDGSIWFFDGAWHQLPGTNTTKAVTFDGSSIWRLAESGNIDRLVNGNWTLVDSGTGTKQIAASNGILYILKDSGQIWQVTP